MSPIEKIAEGIREGDFLTVCQGYEQLTGEWIEPPSIENSDIKDALQRIEKIISMTLKSKTAEKKQRGRPKGSRKKNKSTITPSGEDPSILLNNKTQFITNIPDPEEVRANKVKAEKANKNKIRIDRQPNITYKVKCNECGENFQSNIGGGEIGQKCEECLRNRRTK